MTKYLFILSLFAVLLIAQSAQEEENVIPEQGKVNDENIVDEKTADVQKEDGAIDDTAKTFYKRCPCKCYIGKRVRKAIKQCRYSSYCKLFTCYLYGHYGKKCCGFTKPPTCPCKCVSKHTAYRQCRHKKSCHVTQCFGHYGHYPRYKCCSRY